VLVVVETGAVVVDDVDGGGRSPDEWSGDESPEQAVAAATSATTTAPRHTVPGVSSRLVAPTG
jgi:hypothetical protein